MPPSIPPTRPKPPPAQHTEWQTAPVARQRTRPQRPALLTPTVLFVATVVCVLLAGVEQVGHTPGEAFPLTLLRGWVFAVPLLSILLAHEFGHYTAARLHGVPASLPYFIPVPPMLSIIGTMGAVIGMRGRISTRKALLDIGAAGPLAGMVVAVPVLAVGLQLSEVKPTGDPGYLQEGQSLLYMLIKYVTVGPIPDGYDVFLHPVAFAGWVGLFLTMINLLPVGQLDGGHIAYALFGPKQNKLARMVHGALPLLFLYNLWANFQPYVAHGTLSEQWDLPLGSSLFWLVWFGLLFVMRRWSGRDHPPTDPGELDSARRIVAVFSLALFVFLFMPTPLAIR
ncbi:MAG: site-2 protease family protein [Polyangiaceae bacterium]|jgi:membrane-associated protease RseP (regulator of RpoE activity)|nr:site-2 protease family protein [Polyangiaceae bacterium]